jgi:hypothetical protein
MSQAGLPGTGIGGFFYLLMAGLMPFWELYLTLTGRSSWARWKLVFRQLFIAGGILVGIEAAAWMAQRIFHIQPPTVQVLGIPVLVSHVYIAAPLMLSLTTLAVVLGVIRVWAIADGFLGRNHPPAD